MSKYILIAACLLNSAFCAADSSHDPRIDEVLTYWFGELKSEQDYPQDKGKIWFNGGIKVDNEIRERFGHLVIAAADNKLNGWKESPKGRLALIILLDQFTRNIFRGFPQAFAYDSVARELTLEGLDLGADKELYPVERSFFYLPLEHAEDLKVQELSVLKFTELAADVSRFKSSLDYAVRHYVIIEKFGRFPHRNSVLGRVSTSEEIEFLKGPNSSF